MAKAKIFHSKVSMGLMSFTLILLIFPVVLIFAIEESFAEAGLLLSLIVPVIIFVIHLFLNTQYIVTHKGKLEIRSGLFNLKPIDIQSIHSITPSRSLLSSPATSLDRLEIKYGKFRHILVSPKDKIGFIKALKKVNGDIKVTAEAESFNPRLK